MVSDGSGDATHVFVGLGSNCSTRRDYLREGRHELTHLDALQVRDESTVIETEPWGVETDRPFLNQVVRLDPSNTMDPDKLLNRLMEIENRMGRDRSRAPDRRIDLDLLYWDDRVRSSAPVLPHPGTDKRLFVVRSMVELAPDFRHPKTGETQVELRSRLLRDSNGETNVENNSL